MSYTKVGFARWPSVASRCERLAWVRLILEDEGLEVESNSELDISIALLKEELYLGPIRTLLIHLAVAILKVVK